MALSCLGESKGYMLHASLDTYYISMESILNPLGKGQFGTVYKATKDSTQYAVKQITKNFGLPYEQMKEELTYMEVIRSYTNTANLIYAVDSVEDDLFFYIIMPFLEEGNLTSFISKGNITNEQDAIEYFRQICYGVRILHNIGITHKYLNTDIILISPYQNNTYKYKHQLSIIDLGINMESKPNAIKSIESQFTRAPEYDCKNNDTKVDVFSLGCILYKMVTGTEPFQGSNNEEIAQLKKGNLFPHSLFPHHSLSLFTLRILEGCMQYDPSNRMSSEQLFSLLNLDGMYNNYKEMLLHPKEMSINLINFDRLMQSSRTSTVPIYIKASEPRNGPPNIENNQSIRKKDKTNKMYKVPQINIANITASKHEQAKELPGTVKQFNIKSFLYSKFGICLTIYCTAITLLYLLGTTSTCNECLPCNYELHNFTSVENEGFHHISANDLYDSKFNELVNIVRAITVFQTRISKMHELLYSIAHSTSIASNQTNNNIENITLSANAWMSNNDWKAYITNGLQELTKLIVSTENLLPVQPIQSEQKIEEKVDCPVIACEPSNMTQNTTVETIIINNCTQKECEVIVCVDQTPTINELKEMLVTKDKIIEELNSTQTKLDSICGNINHASHECYFYWCYNGIMENDMVNICKFPNTTLASNDTSGDSDGSENSDNDQ